MHNQNKSLSKGLGILRLIMASQKPLSATVLCKALDIDKSTMSRLIATLVNENFIEYIETSKELRLSDFTKNITQKVSREKILANTQTLLDEVFYLTNECAYIGVLEEDALLILNQVDKSNGVLKTRHSIGLHLPLHTNAFGKIVSAFSPIDIKTLELKKVHLNTHQCNEVAKELDLAQVNEATLWAMKNTNTDSNHSPCPTLAHTTSF